MTLTELREARSFGTPLLDGIAPVPGRRLVNKHPLLAREVAVIQHQRFREWASLRRRNIDVAASEREFVDLATAQCSWPAGAQPERSRRRALPRNRRVGSPDATARRGMEGGAEALLPRLRDRCGGRCFR